MDLDSYQAPFARPTMQKEDSGNANFRMGAIVRIKMMYFLTYDEVEVFPGSQLNMVVGTSFPVLLLVC